MDAVLDDLEMTGTTALESVLPPATAGDLPEVVVGVDLANSAAKMAVGHRGKLTLLRIPNAYLTAQAVMSGDDDPRWQVDGGQARWYGDAALRPGRLPNSLAQGGTAARLDSTIQVEFLLAGVVAALRAAGLPAGAYAVHMGFAVPSDEIERADEGKIRVGRATKAAIQEHLTGRTFTVVREERQRNTWRLTLATVRPQSQTLCAAVTMTRSATGALTTPRDGMIVYDLGHHDIQEAEIIWKPRPRITTRRLGDGVRMIAEEAIGVLDLPNSQALATNILIDPHVYRRGVYTDVRKEVQQVIAGNAEPIMQPVVEAIARTEQFIGFTGGGVVLFRRLLARRLFDRKKRQLVEGQDFVFPSDGYAPFLNAIGALMMERFAHASRG